MAEADLDIVIRTMAKQQHKVLMAEAKKRNARLTGLAAKAKTKEGKVPLKQNAKDLMVLANAAGRLELAAHNAADSYARARRPAREEIRAAEAKAAEAVKAKAAKKAAKKAK